MLVAAVDIGTGSARAGLFDRAGRLLGRAEAPIDVVETADGHAEQSSLQIWQAAAAAVRAARAEAGAAPEQVAGLAFDATCSLVLRDRAGRPLTVSASGDDARDTMLWLDHRATPEAEAINAAGPHAVLDHAGGALSPEMQLPKLLWIKRHLPAAWARIGLAFDLTDFLAFAATGNPARSQCTLACKWGYLAHEPAGWPTDFLARIGLDDLLVRTGQPLLRDARRRRPRAADGRRRRRPRAHPADPRRRRPRRRARRRARRPRPARRGRARAPARADRRHLDLRDGLRGRAAGDPGDLGAVPSAPRCPACG